jgi:hypothetical protein
VTKLSGPARDGSSTRVFAPLTLEIVNDHTSQKGDGTRLTELSACTREFLAISRSMETSIDSLAGRRWSEAGEVEVVMSRTAGPARGLMSLHYVQSSSFILCFSSHSVLSSSLHSHPFLLPIPTEVFLPLPTLPISLSQHGIPFLVFPRICPIAMFHTISLPSRHYVPLMSDITHLLHWHCHV